MCHRIILAVAVGLFLGEVSIGISAAQVVTGNKRGRNKTR